MTGGEQASRLRWILDAPAKDGITLMSQVTSFHVETLRGRLKEKGLQKSTINRYAQILRDLFFRAIEWGDWHGENPLRHVRFYPEERNLRPLSPEETTKIIEAARAIAATGKSPLQKIFADLCEFALNTGMRKSEILSLKWKDLRAGPARRACSGPGWMS